MTQFFDYINDKGTDVWVILGDQDLNQGPLADNQVQPVCHADAEL